MASVSESLECSVCLLTYNLTDRLPKALVCHHTICGQCVDQLKQGSSSFNCPNCRQPCPLGQVSVNFGLTDVLRALCESCLSKPQKQLCPHCNTNICGQCLVKHSEDVHKELLLELSKLDQALSQANDVSNDVSFMNNEHQKERDTIDAIKEAIQSHRDALDKLGKTLEGDVKSSKQSNVNAFVSFSTSLNDKITTSRKFAIHAKNEAGLKFNEETSLEDMMKMRKACQDILKELNLHINKKPVFDYYEFVRSQKPFDPFSIGEFTIKHILGSRRPSSGASGPHVPDYTTLRFESLVGSYGDKPHQLNLPHSVVCTSDFIIVSDTHNHRIKLYDRTLNVKRIVDGKHGTGSYIFCKPCGLSVGPGEHIYIADREDHKIMVLSAQGKYLRDIGEYGAGKNQFQHPLSIAFRDDYALIADTHNYRVKVLTSDGSFVHHIGSKGSFPGQFKYQPIRVALMSAKDGRILVNEYMKKQLHVFSNSGGYQGLFPSQIPDQVDTATILTMTTDTADNVIIAYNTNQLAVYDKSGTIITIIGSYGSKHGQFDNPTGVCVDEQTGHVVVCDRDNNRIQLFKFDMK